MKKLFVVAALTLGLAGCAKDVFDWTDKDAIGPGVF